MPQGSVEIVSLSSAPRRADAILEDGSRLISEKRYVWTFMGTTDEQGGLGSMQTSEGKNVSAFKVRNYADVCNLIKGDRQWLVNNSAEALIGEAHLLTGDDLELIKLDLTAMGINVRLYKEM